MNDRLSEKLYSKNELDQYPILLVELPITEPDMLYVISKMRTLESAEPKQNLEPLDTAPQRMLVGRLPISATILPVYQSNTLISFLPAPPQKRRSSVLLKHVV